MYFLINILNFLIIFASIIFEIIFILKILEAKNFLKIKLISKNLKCLIQWKLIVLVILKKNLIILLKEELFILYILKFLKEELTKFNFKISFKFKDNLNQKNLILFNEIPWDLHITKKNILKKKHYFFKYFFFQKENLLTSKNIQVISPLHLQHLDFISLIQISFTILNSYFDLKKQSLSVLNKKESIFSVEDQIMYIQNIKLFLYNKILFHYNMETYKDLELKKTFKDFFLKWFCSTNHKIIGTLYLIFSGIAGIIGLTYSMMIRIELAVPGASNMFQGDFQLYNVVVTAHALVMIFFL